jgi:hypothetical protein
MKKFSNSGTSGDKALNDLASVQPAALEKVVRSKRHPHLPPEVGQTHFIPKLTIERHLLSI